jgi:hypothetical protein
MTTVLLKNHLYCLVLILMTASTVNAQSPWPRTKAGAYAQLAYQFIPAYNSLFMAGGSDFAINGGKVTERGVQLYGEYGLSRNNTLVCAIPYQFITAPKRITNTAYAQQSYNGLGNVSVSLRHGLKNGRVRWATTLKVDLPAPTRQGEPYRGYAGFTVLPMLNAGMGFDRSYWFAYSGYGLRTDQYSHFLNAGAEGGFHLRNFWLIAATQLVKSMKNGQVQLPTATTDLGLYVNNQSWWSYQLKAIYEHSRFWGVNASFAGAGWAHLVPKSPALSLGIYFKWD